MGKCAICGKDVRLFGEPDGFALKSADPAVADRYVHFVCPSEPAEEKPSPPEPVSPYCARCGAQNPLHHEWCPFAPEMFTVARTHERAYEWSRWRKDR